jgi:energy-converting hydrogenase Eha subunit A
VAGVKTMALGLQVVYDETYSSTILATTGFSKGTLSTIVICYVTYLFSE